MRKKADLGHVVPAVVNREVLGRCGSRREGRIGVLVSVLQRSGPSRGVCMCTCIHTCVYIVSIHIYKVYARELVPMILDYGKL